MYLNNESFACYNSQGIHIPVGKFSIIYRCGVEDFSYYDLNICQAKKQ
jgi:hypothetical protein